MNLKAASTRIPYGEQWFIPPWYQLVEACEWLYRTTGRAEYKELALKWATTHQRLEPLQAWAYGVEARFASDPQTRVRAVALALYLDPNSERLAEISGEERKKAREWLKSNNPFTRDKARPGVADRDEGIKPPGRPEAVRTEGI